MSDALNVLAALAPDGGVTVCVPDMGCALIPLPTVYLVGGSLAVMLLMLGWFLMNSRGFLIFTYAVPLGLVLLALLVASLVTTAFG